MGHVAASDRAEIRDEREFSDGEYRVNMEQANGRITYALEIIFDSGLAWNFTRPNGVYLIAG